VTTSSVLVHGATGFTGKLVCRALRAKGVAFAVSGRSEVKLVDLVRSLGGGIEHHVVDLHSVDSIDKAISGRKIVSACAGPFIDLGEPVLAACARAGVHYIDTTGEQSFVLRVVPRYTAPAEASGACIVPALGYEISLADWAAHLAAERLGPPVESIAICYGLAEPGGAYASRGTLRSAVLQFGSDDAMQFVDGALKREPAAEQVETFELETLPGKRLRAAVSFPAPEAVVVASHTAARTVRTFMPMPATRAQLLHGIRNILPSAARVTGGVLGRLISRAPEGPDDAARKRTAFEIVVRAKGHGNEVTLRVVGHDPYGVTAEVHANAVEQVLAGRVTARGVVAPSVAFDPKSSLAALEPAGVSLRG
jgi:short subunit dehydrogenase-like uncharacterized protein